MNSNEQADATIGGAGWRTERADAFGWLIDGEDYFRAVRDALDRAEREVLIVGWDIDSRLELIRDPDDPRHPSPLCETLNGLLDDKPELHINVLSWDFAAVYVLERELFPAMAFGWGSGERLHFKLDGQHATGASHHQKLVVVDGALAFVGGFDLTKCRWDTRAHAADESRRTDTTGASYRPFHDVQAVLTGAAAGAMRELAAGRWKNATGKSLPDLQPCDGSRLWPADTPIRAERIDVTFARTWAAPDASEVIREVESTYLRMIASARQWIYIENQYFTSGRIAEALAGRLRDADGPEIMLVLPLETSGWLEQATMELRRNRAIATLRDADTHGRLRVLGPARDDANGQTINVHSKLMVVDGRWLRIGSANLSSRSMGLDSECDVMVESAQAAIALAADLLAEHMDGDVQAIARQLRDDGLLATVDAGGGRARRLEPLEVEHGEYDHLLEPIASIADMEQPITRALTDDDDPSQPDGRRDEPAPASDAAFGTPASGWWFLAAIAAIGGAWAFIAWQSGGVDFQSLLAQMRALADHPAAPLAMVVVIILGSLVVAPITGLIALCALLFGPWVASATALTGTLIATLIIHALGARFGPALMQRVPDGVTERIRRLGDASDALAVAALRLIPIAPFSIINLACGAAGVGRGTLLLGTLIGMGPGTVLICLSVDRARAALAGEPVFDSRIVGAIVAAAVAFLALRIWSARNTDE